MRTLDLRSKRKNPGLFEDTGSKTAKGGPKTVENIKEWEKFFASGSFLVLPQQKDVKQVCKASLKLTMKIP